MRNRLVAILMTFGIVLAGLVALPAVEAGPVQPVAQAQASFEDVQNSAYSERNISVRIWEKDRAKPIDHILGPNGGINAGTDRISSYYIPKDTCARVTRGGVRQGIKIGPDRVGLAQGERVVIIAVPC